MDVDGSHVRRLTNSLALDVYPSWSPDGEHIAFMSNRKANLDIFTMTAPGTLVRRRPTPRAPPPHRRTHPRNLRHEPRRQDPAPPDPKLGRRLAALLVTRRKDDRLR